MHVMTHIYRQCQESILVIVITCPAKIKSFNVAASALCNQVHYCIIRVCHIKRRKLSWACHNCFIAGLGTLPFYRWSDFKECNNHLLHS